MRDEAQFVKDENTLCFEDFSIYGQNILKNYPLLEPAIKTDQERMKRHATWFKDRQNPNSIYKKVEKLQKV